MTNWKEYKLGEICKKIGSGATPRGGSDTYLDFGEYALIRSQNVLDFMFSYNGLAYISNEQAQKLNNVTLEQSDILLNITGDSVARVCRVPNHLLPARVNQHVAIIRPNESKINTDFLKYYLLNPVFKEYMLMLSSSGATRNAITKGMIENFPISLPPLPTQTAIAEILSSLDDKIELNNKINAELENLAQTLFKQWFIDFEFPNDQGGPYKSSGGEMIESELGIIPKGWKLKKLKDILINKKNSTKSGTHLDDRKYVPIDKMGMKTLVINDFYSPTEAKSSLLLFEKGDIILGAMRVYFHRVNFAPFPGITRTTCFVLKPYNENDLGFILLYLNQDETIEFANKTSKGTTMPYAVWENGLAEKKLFYPDSSITRNFDDIIKGLLEKITLNIDENRQLTNLRNTLLPKLISGELEVSEVMAEKV